MVLKFKQQFWKDINKVKESANTAIGEANAKLIQIRLAGNKEVETLKAKVAELEAKVAQLAPPAKAHRKSEPAPATEKKVEPAKPAAK